MIPAYVCSKCRRTVPESTEARGRIWPKICDACLVVERERSAHVDVFPESMCGYNIQLDAVITGRRQRKEVFRQIEERSGGRVRPDWR